MNVTGTSTTVPADSGNLAISKIMYHPAAPSAAEMAAGFTDADDFEWVELLNLSDSLTVDLDGVTFLDGITFDLPGTTLSPGARLILAGNIAAFEERYGNGLNVAGQYQSAGANKFSNNGESVMLADAIGNPIASFTYNDAAPWPVSADGAGYSLVLMCPGQNDPIDPKSWRTSAALGGDPGGNDVIPLATWMTDHGIIDLGADGDGDGLEEIFEFASGGDPSEANGPNPVDVNMELDNGSEYLTLTFIQQIGADEVDLLGEFSNDLGSWSSDPLAVVYQGRVNNGNGSSTVMFRSAAPVDAAVELRQFLRLSIAEK